MVCEWGGIQAGGGISSGGIGSGGSSRLGLDSCEGGVHGGCVQGEGVGFMCSTESFYNFILGFKMEWAVHSLCKISAYLT